MRRRRKISALVVAGGCGLVGVVTWAAFGGGSGVQFRTATVGHGDINVTISATGNPNAVVTVQVCSAPSRRCRSSSGIVLGVLSSLLISYFAQWSTEVSPLSIVMAFVFSAVVGVFAGVLTASLACAVGPTYRRPDVPAPPAFAEGLPSGWKDAQPSDGAGRGACGRCLAIPRSTGSNRRVSISNQNVLAAEAQFRAAQAAVRVVDAARFPAVSLAPTVTQTGAGGPSSINRCMSSRSM